ncbi:MAG: hypothetical protein ABL933_17355 [Methyloglobulus sp.]|nr:hypothetical protein [Methyloglobulus sp.]
MLLLRVVARSCAGLGEENTVKKAAECVAKNLQAEAYPRQIICYTPMGNPVKVMATDADHEAFLLKMNPQPTEQAPC